MIKYLAFGFIDFSFLGFGVAELGNDFFLKNRFGGIENFI
jgi:hypothetical protein